MGKATSCDSARREEAVEREEARSSGVEVERRRAEAGAEEEMVGVGVGDAMMVDLSCCKRRSAVRMRSGERKFGEGSTSGDRAVLQAMKVS